ncbi:hypothetical protein NXX56_29270, partial [Bacteroides thetaiotaomicron]|nr:hypothetical protein [Bacteroides thetaiotaomicron]
HRYSVKRLTQFVAEHGQVVVELLRGYLCVGLGRDYIFVCPNTRLTLKGASLLKANVAKSHDDCNEMILT